MNDVNSEITEESVRNYLQNRIKNDFEIIVRRDIWDFEVQMRHKLFPDYYVATTFDLIQNVGKEFLDVMMKELWVYWIRHVFGSSPFKDE